MSMNVSPLSPATSAATAGSRSTVSAGSAGTGGFAGILTQFLSDAGAQQAHAEHAVQNFVTGRADHVHNVMLDLAKADLSFHLVLEIRNRLSDAYQDIMRMQV
jgi:flagellar hook-basal body complex protein FliE